MYYCKELNSLSVLSLYEGELVGSVNKLLFDKKLKKICKFELVGSDGVKLFLAAKNVYHVGKNALTIKNNNLISIKEEFQEFCVAPVGAKAYSIKGEFLGVISEIAVDDKFITSNIVLDNGEALNINNLATCGKNTLIFYKDTEKTKIKQFAPKQPKTYKRKKIAVVESLPIEMKTEIKENVQERFNQDSSFLIGRTCTKDILNFNNELLIKSQSVINKKNLKEITKYGKLKELMIYSK